MVKCFKTLVHGVVLKTVVIYCDTMVPNCGMLTLENVGTAVNYYGIFIKLDPGSYLCKNYQGYFDT
jgi:hypothetical protein